MVADEQPTPSEARRILSEGKALYQRARKRLSAGDQEAIETRLAALQSAIRLGKGDALTEAADAVLRSCDTTMAFARKSKLRELVESVGFAFGLALCLRALLFEPFQIPSGSMEQTLLVGDYLFVAKSSYGIRIPFTTDYVARWSEPSRGDIIVFSFPVQEVRTQFGVACLTWQVRQYAAINGGLPATLVDSNDVPQSPRCSLVDRTVDAWGTPFRYQVTGDSFDLRSAGRDRTFDTGDDMTQADSAFVDNSSGSCDATQMFLVKNYIKRIIGLPGERIEVRDGVLYVNDVPMEYGDSSPSVGGRYAGMLTTETMDSGRSYTIQTLDGTMGDFGPVTVREGYLFVMGDNRDGSLDSRCWGQVPIENIKGEAQVIFYSRDRVNRQIRWERFGRIIH